MIGIAGFTGLTWRDAVLQEHPGEQQLWKAAQTVVSQLARRIGERPAVAWVHTAAVLAHAAHYGLIGAVDMDTPDGLRCGIETLAGSHPGLACWADPAVNALWDKTITPEEARQIGDLYRQHPVADLPVVPDGYRIGDLYQQLSEEARKGRALCQTPQWVTDLLLRLSLDHAVDEAGWDGLPALRMIDPSCGTGHILVETLLRLEGWHWTSPRGPKRDSGESMAAALAQVHGVDLDPYAVAVARYRLAALSATAAGVPLEKLPEDLPLNVACADSLLDESEPLLERGRYDVVIANPPYIVAKNKQANDAIRKRYPDVCHMKYSLALPFHALMNELLRPGGWCAQLTGNAFMKREYGQKYIEDYLVKYDLRWVIDTSGAYIPGHGTPTLILVNRNQPPVGDTVSSMLGVNGEPRVPELPARGYVWGDIRRWAAERDAAARMDALLQRAGEAEAPAEPEVADEVQVPPRDTPAPPAPKRWRAVPLPETDQLDLFAEVTS